MAKKVKLTPEEYRKKWGVPDWHIAKAYPLKLSETRWRWEFLRRSGAYRNDWEQWHIKLQQFDEWNIGTQENGWEKMSPLGKQLRIVFSKYGIHQRPIDPSIQNPKSIFFEKERPDIGKHYTVLQSGCLYEKVNQWAITRDQKKWPDVNYPLVLLENTCAFIFDYSKPISPQIHKAEKLLFEQQTILKCKIADTRLHLNNFTLYLRALDAEAENATYEDIGKTLESKSKRPRARGDEILKAAHKIQVLLT
jgi:hypothetical protein